MANAAVRYSFNNANGLPVRLTWIRANLLVSEKSGSDHAAGLAPELTGTDRESIGHTD